jgi:hypothetical protein
MTPPMKKKQMKAYKITATAIDRNGVEIDANQAETLGEAYGMIYLTKERAKEAAENLADDLPEGYETSKYEVEEIEISELTVGQKYDVQSVRDAGFSIDDAGYQTGDYFDVAGRYSGPDQNGIEPAPKYGW